MKQVWFGAWTENAEGQVTGCGADDSMVLSIQEEGGNVIDVRLESFDLAHAHTIEAALGNIQSWLKNQLKARDASLNSSRL